MFLGGFFYISCINGGAIQLFGGVGSLINDYLIANISLSLPVKKI